MVCVGQVCHMTSTQVDVMKITQLLCKVSHPLSRTLSLAPHWSPSNPEISIHGHTGSHAGAGYIHRLRRARRCRGRSRRLTRENVRPRVWTSTRCGDSFLDHPSAGICFDRCRFPPVLAASRCTLCRSSRDLSCVPPFLERRARFFVTMASACTASSEPRKKSLTSGGGCSAGLCDVKRSRHDIHVRHSSLHELRTHAAC